MKKHKNVRNIVKIRACTVCKRKIKKYAERKEELGLDPPGYPVETISGLI